MLQLLEHTDFGSTAVLSVLSTFNRAARKIQQVTWFWYHGLGVGWMVVYGTT